MLPRDAMDIAVLPKPSNDETDDNMNTDENSRPRRVVLAFVDNKSPKQHSKEINNTALRDDIIPDTRSP